VLHRAASSRPSAADNPDPEAPAPGGSTAYSLGSSAIAAATAPATPPRTHL